MPNIRSAAKRLRQSKVRYLRHKAIKSTMRTAIRNFQKAAATEPQEAARLFVLAQKAIDKAARKGVVHRNQAARRKSRLALSMRKAAAPGRTATAGDGGSGAVPGGKDAAGA